MSEIIYLTHEGLEKLQGELSYLKNEKRMEIAAKLKEAISFGDLSENAEYAEARDEQSAVESRILELEEQLKNVQIIEDSNKKENKVSIGSKVTISNEGKEEDYIIVGSKEADILNKPAKISNDSEVGKALIGKKKGDVVKVKSQAGINEYKIIDIK
ncbi:MAG: transcription elongation factor GreA [Candidatus Gracilibacteria bacterium]|nr:transcription elongation factor GreA [Candidatus Gracilibacteria bacterium]